MQATCNGIDVYFERAGAGARLLFLNGSGATLESSGFIVAAFAKSFDVLAHDQRGLGRTAVPQGPYSMADYAADAIALLDHVGWESCRVAGISFGGMVAQELAVTVAERVERLALICTSPGGAGGASYPLHEVAAMPAEEQAEVRRRILDTRFTDAYLADPAHASDAALAHAMTRAAPTDAEVLRGMREQLEARRYHDVADRLHRVTCPTLIAAGRYDGIAPVENSEAIAARIPGSDLRVYEGGHAFVAQDRQAFPELFAFLAG